MAWGLAFLLSLIPILVLRWNLAFERERTASELEARMKESFSRAGELLKTESDVGFWAGEAARRFREKTLELSLDPDSPEGLGGAAGRALRSIPLPGIPRCRAWVFSFPGGNIDSIKPCRGEPLENFGAGILGGALREIAREAVRSKREEAGDGKGVGRPSARNFEPRLRSLFGPGISGDLFAEDFRGVPFNVIFKTSFHLLVWDFFITGQKIVGGFVFLFPLEDHPGRQAVSLIMKNWDRKGFFPAFLPLSIDGMRREKLPLVHPGIEKTSLRMTFSRMQKGIRRTTSKDPAFPDDRIRALSPLVGRLLRFPEQPGWSGWLVPLDGVAEHAGFLVAKDRRGATLPGENLLFFASFFWLGIWILVGVRAFLFGAGFSVSFRTSLLFWFFLILATPISLLWGAGTRFLNDFSSNLLEARFEELKSVLQRIEADSVGLGRPFVELLDRKIRSPGFLQELAKVQSSPARATCDRFIESFVRTFTSQKLFPVTAIILGKDGLTIQYNSPSLNRDIVWLLNRIVSRQWNIQRDLARGVGPKREEEGDEASFSLGIGKGEMEEAEFLSIKNKRYRLEKRDILVRGKAQAQIFLAWEMGPLFGDFLRKSLVKSAGELAETGMNLGFFRLTGSRLTDFGENLHGFSGHMDLREFAVLAKKHPVRRTRKDRNDIILAFRSDRIPDHILLGRASMDPVDRKILFAKVSFALIGTALFFLAISAAHVLSRRVARPIELMTEGIRRIATGDLETAISQRRGDELGRTAGLLDRMTQWLRERRVMSRFVAPQVLDIVSGGDYRVAMEGSIRDVAILVCDIRSFTTLSETHPPETIFALVNRHMEKMTEAIQQNQGCIDRFVGDAVQAVFYETSPTRGRMCPKSQDEPQDAAVSGQGHGWPVLGPTGAVLEGTSPTTGRMWPKSQDGAVLEGTSPPGASVRALKAAISMMKAHQELQDVRTRLNEVGYRIGIGIERGRVIAGVIGDAAGGRLDYGVIGETLKGATDLESASKKASHTGIIVSETVRRELRDAGSLVPLKIGEETLWELGELALPANLSSSESDARGRPSPGFRQEGGASAGEAFPGLASMEGDVPGFRQDGEAFPGLASPPRSWDVPPVRAINGGAEKGKSQTPGASENTHFGHPYRGTGEPLPLAALLLWLLPLAIGVFSLASWMDLTLSRRAEEAGRRVSRRIGVVPHSFSAEVQAGAWLNSLSSRIESRVKATGTIPGKRDLESILSAVCRIIPGSAWFAVEKTSFVHPTIEGEEAAAVCTVIASGGNGDAFQFAPLDVEYLSSVAMLESSGNSSRLTDSKMGGRHGVFQKWLDLFLPRLGRVSATYASKLSFLALGNPYPIRIQLKNATLFIDLFSSRQPGTLPVKRRLNHWAGGVVFLLPRISGAAFSGKMLFRNLSREGFQVAMEIGAGKKARRLVTSGWKGNLRAGAGGSSEKVPGFVSSSISIPGRIPVSLRIGIPAPGPTRAERMTAGTLFGLLSFWFVAGGMIFWKRDDLEKTSTLSLHGQFLAVFMLLGFSASVPVLLFLEQSSAERISRARSDGATAFLERMDSFTEATNLISGTIPSAMEATLEPVRDFSEVALSSGTDPVTGHPVIYAVEDRTLSRGLDIRDASLFHQNGTFMIISHKKSQAYSFRAFFGTLHEIFRRFGNREFPSIRHSDIHLLAAEQIDSTLRGVTPPDWTARLLNAPMSILTISGLGEGSQVFFTRHFKGGGKPWMFSQTIFNSRFLLAQVLSHRKEKGSSGKERDGNIFFNTIAYPMFSWATPVLAREIEWQISGDGKPFRGGTRRSNQELVMPIPRVFRKLVVEARFSGELTQDSVIREGKEFLLFSKPEKTYKVFICNGVLPVDPIVAPIRKAAAREGSFLLVLIVLTVGLAMVVGNNVLRPLRRFSGAVAAIMNRDFGTRLPEDRGDEFGALAKAFNKMAEHVEEGKLLSRFVSDSVQVAARSHRIGSTTGKGESVEVVVLFAALGDMNQRILGDDPTKVISDLNIFLGAGAASVRSAAGDVDKFIGEKLLAVFRLGEGCSREDLLRKALWADLEMRTKVRSIPGFAHSPVATGISMGTVLSGILGNPSVRLEMTVLGDTVNLASRLCDLAKSKGGGIAFDGGTWKHMDRLFSREKGEKPQSLGRVPLKGKSLPVEVFLIPDPSRN